ncbi:MAG: VWA domain-containing protein [Planctomycetes bacterium]|nr:VWA domain-containing protein [Planctomycetota bacterium]
MSISFDHPRLLLLALLIVPLTIIGWRSLAGQDRLRRTTVVVMRSLFVVALVILLAGPSTRREHDHLTVIGLLDVSGSVQRFAQIPSDPEERLSYIAALRSWFRAATSTKAPEDRFGLVVFDGDAIAVSAPTRGEHLDEMPDGIVATGTSIEAAIRLGLAMFPPDTARRLVLVSDGNETIGDAVTAARQAAGGSGDTGDAADARSVPIDVLPIAYRVAGDVQILHVEAPPHAQPGQTVTVRINLEATGETTGRLTLRREGVPVDLNGGRPGRSRRIAVPAGRSVHLAPVRLGETPVNRFVAVFEPDDADEDVLPDNNRAESFTATPSRGRILIVDRSPAGPHPLAEMLAAAQLPVTVQTPADLPADLLSLQNYDLIVLDDVPAFEMGTDQHELLSRYVNDLGGGLIMVGGEDSFGAGGWNGTAVEDVLPLELDPPRELRLPEAALVLVLDQSGSMSRHVAGARATQQEVANEAAALAIESLRSESLVGVVTFHSFATEYVPLQRNEDPEAIANRVRRISAGGGTDLAPALRKAHRMLRDVKTDRKRVVCLTDGQSEGADLEPIAQRMVDDDIKITTIAVGDDADHETLKKLAEIGQGEFFPVYNPKALPRVLVDSVQVINKPLIKEVPFVPVVRATGSTLTAGMADAPELAGLVVTAPRPDPTAVVEMSHPEGEPLLAHWQAGLGRAAAFTSDLGGPWSRGWDGWPVAEAFWTQLVRRIARPAVSQDAELYAEIRDGRLSITVEAIGEEGYLDYLRVDGTVYTPSGRSVPVRLTQTGPGRYEGSARADEPGNYIVALNPRRGERRLAPLIGGASRPTGDEFRRYRSNLDLLESIVQITGGRRLEIADPAAVDLFDRTGMPPSVSLLPAWRTLLVLALALMLLDVASRRIAWSAAAIRATLAHLVGRVTPAHVRAGEAAATLASLREVSSALDDRVRAESQRAGTLPKPAPKPRTPERPTKAAPPEPSRISAALDAFLGRRAKKHDEPAEAPREADEEPSRPDAATETTSGLLEAKRRARKRIGD